MVITHWTIIRRGILARNGLVLMQHDNLVPEQLYGDLEFSYPKFFKMDKLCKWAFIAAECTIGGKDMEHHHADGSRVALALSTSHGCLEVDKRYKDSMDVPSPALFVYTLPNIMLGEICIRYGFKGEQVCMVSDAFDAREIFFAGSEFLKAGMDACLCGWVDVQEGISDVALFWVSKAGKGVAFTPENLGELYAHYTK